MGGDVHDFVVIEVQPGDRVMRFGSPRLLLDALGTPLRIELHNAVALRVLHVIREHRCAAHTACCVLEERSESASIEDVVAEHQDRKSTRLNSSHGYISYAVFCLKKKSK